MSLLQKTAVLIAVCSVGLPGSLWAQRDFSGVVISTEHVAGSVHVLFGAGGNIGVSAGEDGVFLIDDQFAPLTERIQAAVGEISENPIRFVVNTHWHGDHTGGNENLGQAGAVVVAHDNVRKRMSVKTFSKTFNVEIPASPKGALPVVTFSDGVKFHLNGDTIHVFHVSHAHTDGDAMVYFENSNVLHGGDVFFNQMYPFIDVESGGNIKGIVGAVERALKMINDDTKIIPGHGPVTDIEGLRVYHSMLDTIANRVSKMVDEGATVEEVQSSDVTKEWEAVWGNGFMKKDRFLGLVYASFVEDAM